MTREEAIKMAIEALKAECCSTDAPTRTLESEEK